MLPLTNAMKSSSGKQVEQDLPRLVVPKIRLKYSVRFVSKRFPFGVQGQLWSYRAANVVNEPRQKPSEMLFGT